MSISSTLTSLPGGCVEHDKKISKLNKWVHKWQARVAVQLADENSAYSSYLHDLSWYFETFCTGYRPGIHDGQRFTRSAQKPRLEAAEVAEWLGLCGHHPGGYFSVAPDNSTSWIIIDIDKNSVYHPSVSGEQALEPVLNAAKECGLNREILFRSSYSLGFHIHYPLSQSIRSKKAAKILRDCFLKEGLLVRDGVLEIFPNDAQSGLFKVIRGPLSGNGNAFYLDGLDMWCEDLDVFRQIFIQRSCSNALRSSAIEAPLLSTCSSNRRGPVNINNTSFESIRARLAEGFTSTGQTQDVQFAALQCARLIEGDSTVEGLRKRCSELVCSAPGFKEYCSHQKEIESGHYWSISTLNKALDLESGGYQCWQQKHNEAQHNDARQRALNALQEARKASQDYVSTNKAIRALQSLYGAPVKSWWMKAANADLLAELKALVVAGS